MYANVHTYISYKRGVFFLKNWAQFGLAFVSKILLFPLFYYFYYIVI